MPEIVGYVDRLTAHPGETVAVHVSTDASEYEADLVRLIHGDVNPEGPGAKLQEVPCELERSWPGRVQETARGSFATIESSRVLDALRSFTLAMWVFPTRIASDEVQG